MIFKLLKFIIILSIGIFLGFLIDDPNSELKYSNSGRPYNCKTLIHENYASYKLDDDFSAKDALASINRNCGKDGHLWQD